MNKTHLPAIAKLVSALVKCKGAKDEACDDFATLEHSLAHKKGITDPNALAASIGRKKLGSAEMARRSAAGRK